MPLEELKFAFGAIDDGFAKRNREADGRIDDLIVIRVIVHKPAVVIHVYAKFIGKCLCHARFKVISL